MDVRPLDFGDQNPSDIGDVAPTNPVLGITESNSFGGDIWSRRKPRSQPNQQFAPDPKIEEKFLPRRNSFDAIVLSRVTPKNGTHPVKYKVLRQDGRVLQANAGMKEGFYCDYRNGDTVTVHETQIPDVYSIIGEPRGKTMQLIEAVWLGPSLMNLAAYVPFDTTITYSGDELILSTPYIVIGGETESAMYEINFKLNIDSNNTVDEADEIYLYNSCYESSLPDMTQKKIKGIAFDKGSGFKIKDGDCLGGVWLSGGSTDFMPFQPSGGGPIRWTGDPRLAGSLKIGTFIPQGWIKIHSSGDPCVWLGHGDSRHMYRFPSNGPVIHSYLRVCGISEVTDGIAIQLEHSATGASGIVNYKDCLGYCRSFTVDKGIITGGYQLQTVSQSPPVNFSDAAAGDYDPC
jgi:hypothetical protein